MNLRMCKTIEERRKLMEKECKVSLKNIGQYLFDEEVASTRNCENMIGTTQIPLGIAGPLPLHSINDERSTMNEYYLPLATSEGALVASVNRGCKAITESGGATVAVEHVGVTRGPVLKTSGIRESIRLKKWIEDHQQELKTIAKTTSSHIDLTKIGIRMTGSYVYIRFYFNTKDAMGMNMATIATSVIIQTIEQSTHIRCVSVAGNFDIDKKPAWLNSISGRGKRVWAEAVIPEAILQKTLKTTARHMYETWLSKCMLGSAMSGSMAFNAHFANVVAALFIATGQDPAHVVEGSLGITTTEVITGTDDLYISVYLPDLMLGTVGGGTGLATQKEALSMLGVAGPSADGDGKNAEKFAGIVGAAVLAGEISLLASLSQGTLAQAHKKLARGQGMANDK